MASPLFEGMLSVSLMGLAAVAYVQGDNAALRSFDMVEKEDAVTRLKLFVGNNIDCRKSLDDSANVNSCSNFTSCPLPSTINDATVGIKTVLNSGATFTSKGASGVLANDLTAKAICSSADDSICFYHKSALPGSKWEATFDKINNNDIGKISCPSNSEQAATCSELVLDFEELNEQVPILGAVPITTQYIFKHGVEFSTLNTLGHAPPAWSNTNCEATAPKFRTGFPLYIYKYSSTTYTAFGGQQEAPYVPANAIFGEYFLSDNHGYVGNKHQCLFFAMQYQPSINVSEVSGLLTDITLSEGWQIMAYNRAGTLVGSALAKSGANQSFDSIKFVITPTAGNFISRLEFWGSKQDNGSGAGQEIGWGLDRVSASYNCPP